jgi:Mce-associated membrane protein
MSTPASGLETSVPVDEVIITDEPEVRADADTADTADGRAKPVGRRSWKRAIAYGLLPGLALILAAGAGYLKWENDSVRESQAAQTGSVKAAADSTIALLSYHPDTVEKELGAARDRLTGTFRDTYTELTNNVVIPGAKEKHISAVADVPAVASVSATEQRAVVLVFVNQTVNVGNDAPSSTASSVRVTLDKVDDRWLISQFDPV